MKFKSHALRLAEFIQRFTPIWKNEIMNEYPSSISYYPKEWILLLSSLSENDLFEIDNKKIIAQINETSFASFMLEIQELSCIDKIQNHSKTLLENGAYQGVKKKKRHEIEHIVPILTKINSQTKIKKIIDVGGGVGHLARILAHYGEIPTVSIDKNKDFQKIGEKRVLRYPRKKTSAEVMFFNTNLDLEQTTNSEIFEKDSFCVGLHSCGSLSNLLIKGAVQNKLAGILNFGCCYYRLDPSLDFPISCFYNENNLPAFNLYSLTLATRSHAKSSLENYLLKKRVKQYRYALHLFLMKYFFINNHFDVGEIQTKLYWRPFSEYISKKLEELKISHKFTHKDFEQFYADPLLQKELQTMFICNIIRWQFGRLLEIYLLLDRCLYLSENNFDVTLEQYFCEELSPRNLGILALYRKKSMS